MKKFGEQVKEARMAKRPSMSQSRLAAGAYTDQSAISDIELGKIDFGDGLGGELAGRVAVALGGKLQIGTDGFELVFPGEVATP
jgi:transcriptional regulator with XRE-family HTH domain